MGWLTWKRGRGGVGVFFSVFFFSFSNPVWRDYVSPFVVFIVQYNKKNNLQKICKTVSQKRLYAAKNRLFEVGKALFEENKIDIGTCRLILKSNYNR